MRVPAPGAARRSLCALFLALAVAIACVLVLSMQIPSAAASSISAGARGGRVVDEAFDEEDDDDDDDDWDFMDDDAILSMATRSTDNDVDGGAYPKKEDACALSLPPERVNDDFCDCEQDGSDEPGTSACSHVLLRSDATSRSFGLMFQCRSGGRQISSAFVSDGVCDCCDGSDEIKSACPDTCEAERRQTLEKLQTRLDTVRNGLRVRQQLKTQAVDKIQQLATDFERLAEAFATGQRAFEDLQRRAQQMPELQPQLEQSYHVLRSVQYVTYVQSRVVDAQTFSDAAWKPAFVTLVGHCFPFTVNEKELKGGTPNVIPREYVMVLCPFQNVTQTEPSYPRWALAERLTKIGADADADEEKEQEEVPRPIGLGIWNEWLDPDEEAAGFLRKQRYDHGEPCANGQERETRVELTCGATNRVVAVDELEMCVYEIRFETPAACDPSEERALLEEVTQVELLVNQHQKAEQAGGSVSSHEEL
ncbi:hypothetical protein BBJ28_00001360 [Nothophytophthora sp. Chile5]|nr:hypothetical protein BBJ28_00001360 [Nothophytophthora sp. Chile5]